MDADLNSVLWQAFEDRAFRERFFTNGIAETLRQNGIPDEHIALFEAGEIAPLLDIGLVPRGALRWGTFWLNVLAERRARGVTCTLEDVYRTADLA